MNALLHSVRLVVQDLLSSLVFAIALSTTKDVRLATAAALATSLVQLGVGRMRGRPANAMQWLSLGLVVVLGGATLLFSDPRFVMFKPTVIMSAIGLVMLKPGWMTRYLPAAAVEHGRDLANGFGYAWASLMFVTALANAIVAARGDIVLWGRFVAIFPLSSKLVLFAIQYATMRIVIGKRVRAAAESG